MDNLLEDVADIVWLRDALQFVQALASFSSFLYNKAEEGYLPKLPSFSVW